MAEHKERRIERILMLLDTKSIGNGPVYLRLAIHHFVKTILEVCTKNGLLLWSLKLFDSSISPFSFRSRAEKLLGKWASDDVQFDSAQFDSAEDAGCNLTKFSYVLNRIHRLKREKNSAPNVDFIVKAIQEALEDYTWDSLIVSDGSSSSSSSEKVHSNILVLFSSFPKARKEMNNFFNTSDEALEKIIPSNFQALQTTFQRKNIHPLWIDTSTTPKCYYDLAFERVVCTTLGKIGWGMTFVDNLLLELVCPLLEGGFGTNNLPIKRMRAIQCWLQQEKEKLMSILKDHTNALKMVICEALKLKENKDLAFSIISEAKVQEGAILEEQQPECKICAIPHISINKAHEYIELLDEKLNGLNLIEMDIQTLAFRVVKDTLHAIQVLFRHANENDSNKREGYNGTSNLALNRLMDLLLKSPKILGQKYKNCTHEADGNGAHNLLIKVKEYELQIKLRFEIILAWQDGQLNQVEGKYFEETRTQLTNEICILLGVIQFNLPGGIFEGESLLDFSNRVIRPRYCDSLPKVIENIYSIMELNGFPDLEAEAFSTSKEIHLSSQACRPNGTCGKDMSSPEKKLKEAKEKRERASRFSHFHRGAQNLLRQRTMRMQVLRSKRKHQDVKESKDFARCSDVHFVPETPM